MILDSMDDELEIEAAPGGSLGTILVIEDDPRMQKVLRRTFGGERYAVAVAGDGRTGLEMFCGERPIAVILDLILPEISGRELCQTFKSIASETPIIVLSAVSEVGAERQETREPFRSSFVALGASVRGQTLVFGPGICHVRFRTALLSQLL